MLGILEGRDKPGQCIRLIFGLDLGLGNCRILYMAVLDKIMQLFRIDRKLGRVRGGIKKDSTHVCEEAVN